MAKGATHLRVSIKLRKQPGKMQAQRILSLMQGTHAACKEGFAMWMADTITSGSYPANIALGCMG